MSIFVERFHGARFCDSVPALSSHCSIGSLCCVSPCIALFLWIVLSSVRSVGEVIQWYSSFLRSLAVECLLIFKVSVNGRVEEW